MIGARKNPAWSTTSHTWFKSRNRRNRTLAASEKPTTIVKSAAQYVENAAMAASDGRCPNALRNTTITSANTSSVITAFEIDVTTRIHDGTRALVRRYPRVWRDVKPAFVASEKKSHRNRPTMRFSLYFGLDANRNENTPISTMNMLIGLSNAQ